MIRLPALPKLPPALLWAVAASLATAFVLHSCERPPPPVLVVRTDTADASEWRQRAAELGQQVTQDSGLVASLRAKLSGVQTYRPERVTVYDTTILLRRDTVLLAATLEGAHRLSRTLALPVGDSAGSHHPADVAAQEIGNCDRRLSLAADGRVQCVPARAGHLVAFVGAGVTSEPWGRGLPPPIRPYLAAGLRWTPSFRSAWAVELRGDAEGRVVLAVRRGLRLF